MKHFLVGSFAKPLTLWQWNERDGSFSYLSTIIDDGETCAPTWASLSSCKKYIYCTNELPEGATVAAFEIIQSEDVTADAFQFRFLNRVPSAGGWPCHIALTPSIAIISNFKTGTVGFLPIKKSGELEFSVCAINNNETAGAEVAHAHEVVFGTDAIFYVCDLGMDCIYTFRRESTNDIWSDVALISKLNFPSKSGPRHLIIHPNGRLAYAIMELTSCVYVLDINAETSELSLCRSEPYSTLRDTETSDGMGGAELLLSSDCRFLYVSNRDVADTIVDRSSIGVFEVLGDGSDLKLLQHVHSGGRHPRHMALVSDGNHLVVANKESHNLVTFSINRESGLLSESPIFSTASSEHCRDPSLLLELNA